MQTKQKYGGLDRFRVAAAFLVIAIHTSPLESLNAGADFFLTRVLARVAVPFFFMVTGQFVAAQFADSADKGTALFLKYLKKTALLYLFCIVLYLPIGIYAGHYADLTLGSLLRMLFFDGTFYHLWYFPACMLGMALVYLMSRFMGLGAMTAVSAVLYVIGLLGDSYFGLVQKVPPLEAIYEFGFRISSYTRNGIFLAPLFLVLGMWIARLAEGRDAAAGTVEGADVVPEANGVLAATTAEGANAVLAATTAEGANSVLAATTAEKANGALGADAKASASGKKESGTEEAGAHSGKKAETGRGRREIIICCAGLVLSFAVMTAEAFTLRHFGLQRHDSMYFALVPTMFFLYICLMKLPSAPEKLFRTTAMWIYVLHPAMIVAVRGVGKVFHMTSYIVDNSIVHYLLVLQFSLIAGVVMVYLQYCVLLKLLRSFDIRVWAKERVQSIRKGSSKKRGQSAETGAGEDGKDIADSAKGVSARAEDKPEENEKEKREAAVSQAAIPETASIGKRLVLPPKKNASEPKAGRDDQVEAMPEMKTRKRVESEGILGTETQEVAKSKATKKKKEETVSGLNAQKTAAAGTAQETQVLGSAEAEVILAAEAQKLAEEADEAGMLEIETQKAVEPEGILEPETLELAEEIDDLETLETKEENKPTKREKPFFPEIDPDEELIARELAAEEERILREQERKRIDLQKITLPQAATGSRGLRRGGNPKKMLPQKPAVPKKAPLPEFSGPQNDFRAWIELDAAALANNVEFLRSRIPERCRLMPAVKAEAYGHGAVIIARQLNKLNVNAFCVACLSEGITLRKAGVKGKILILGYTSPVDFPLLNRYLLTQAVIDYDYAQALNRFGKPVHVHIAIDTGMHRLGIRCENLEEITSVYKMKNLIIDGLFTHLSASDSLRPEDLAFTNSQVQAFYQVVDFLKSNGCPCRGLHMLASYGILNLLTGKEKSRKNLHRSANNHGISNYMELAGDYVRPGIALYGVLETETDSILWQEHLKPVLSLKAKVVSVRNLYAGEAAGYGLAFTAKHDMKMATLSIGYADGLPRELSYGIGSVLINGCSAPIIGRICMDQTLVDVSNIPRIQPGSTAVLIGKSGSLEITAGHVADQCGTITNEILSRLGARLNRIMI